MRRVRIARLAVSILCFAVSSSLGYSQNIDRTERVLISTPRPYDRVVSGIESLGGTVRNQFAYVDGIAADIPPGAMAAVRNLVGANAVAKDELVAHPVGADMTLGKSLGGKQIGRVTPARFKSARAISADGVAAFAAAHGSSYILNTAGIGLDKLHSKGIIGRGVIVAVLDSGIRPGFPSLDLDHSIIGGIDFVADGMGFSNLNNDGHGTFVANLISGKVELDLSGNPRLLNAISSYAPSALFDGNAIALIGSAPASKIYVVRVFGADPNLGTPESTILAAIQHVIDRRRDYDRGRPGGIKIEVCNLSFGNTTFKAGRDMLDRSVDALMAAGIVPVVSVGNAGPATMTTASPGSSFSALTVGAASFARNERILHEFEDGEGMGELWRPFSGTQTAYFSSRGPNADGRPDPDVVASGFANLAQGYASASDLTIASGTSFSAPIVAGVAAILRQAFPRAEAAEIRNAIIASADRSVLADGSTRLDQGTGLVQAQAAYELLAAGKVSGDIPRMPFPTHDVRTNIELGTNLVVESGRYGATLSLKPGQRKDVLYNVTARTSQVTITLSHVSPGPRQNALFGDDILLFVHSSKTSSIHVIGDYVASAYTLGGVWVVDDPEPGILRISVTGDWTNSGTISADVSVSSATGAGGKISAEGRISDSETVTIPFTIPSAVNLAEFRLLWNQDWSRYPTNDIDMVLVDPDGTVNSDAATLDVPEMTKIVNPKPGTWEVRIRGFDLPAGTDHFTLKVILDGKVVK